MRERKRRHDDTHRPIKIRRAKGASMPHFVQDPPNELTEVVIHQKHFLLSPFVAGEILELRKQDEVHWKTRRTLLREIERLRTALDRISLANVDEGEALQLQHVASDALLQGFCCGHPRGRIVPVHGGRALYVCDDCGLRTDQ